MDDSTIQQHCCLAAVFDVDVDPFQKKKKATSDRTTLVVVATQPLPRDVGMAEDHGAPEAGQLSRTRARGRRETESRQRVSGAKSP